MASCCIPFCQSSRKASKQRWSFHRFPRDDAQKKEWIRIINDEFGCDFKISNSTRICAKHFQQEDFEMRGKRTIRPGVIPTVFSCEAEDKPEGEEVKKNLRRRSSVAKSDLDIGVSDDEDFSRLGCDSSFNFFQDLDESVENKLPGPELGGTVEKKNVNSRLSLDSAKDSRIGLTRNRTSSRRSVSLLPPAPPPKTIIQMRLGKPTKADGIDLMMECIEEELSPWQQEASKKAAEEYKATMEIIQAIKNGTVPAALQAKFENQGINCKPKQDPIYPKKKKKEKKKVVEDTSSVLTVKTLSVQQNQKHGGKQNDLQGSPIQQFTFQLMKPNSWTLVQPSSPSSNLLIATNVNNNNPQVKTIFSRSKISLKDTPPAIMESILKPPAAIKAKPIPVKPPMSIKTPTPIKTISQNTSVSEPNKVSPAGVKRLADTPPPVPRKKSVPSTVVTEEKAFVDEDYYGIFKGDPNHTDVKGAYKFKCHLCTKNLPSNIRAMSHLQAHMENSKQYNLDLSDLTVCKYCFVQFETPYAMQSHMEDVHLNNSQLMCRICERDYQDKHSLIQHMKTNHKLREMPYVCGVCTFRSSRYNDVIDHFGMVHYNTDKAMCRYCLKVFTIKITNCGTGILTHFSAHLQRHQLKSARKCPNCKLTFLNVQEARRHRLIDHISFDGHKDIEPLSLSIMNNVMFTAPEDISNAVSKAKSLNAPQNSRASQSRNLKLVTFEAAQCSECQTMIYSSEHFIKYMECTPCHFSTNCNKAYANHMVDSHSVGIVRHPTTSRPALQLSSVMYCLCGFSGKIGNVLADHLVRCRKKSCYPTQQIAFTYVDDDGDSLPFVGGNDQAALLNVLGLVKKPVSNSDDSDESKAPIKLKIKTAQNNKSRKSKISIIQDNDEASATQVCSEILTDLIDAVINSKNIAEVKDEGKVESSDSQDQSNANDCKQDTSKELSGETESSNKTIKKPIKLTLSASLKKKGHKRKLSAFRKKSSYKAKLNAAPQKDKNENANVDSTEKDPEEKKEAVDVEQTERQILKDKVIKDDGDNESEKKA